ncbi:cystatin-F [Thomomys bottae]
MATQNDDSRGSQKLHRKESRSQKTKQNAVQRLGEQEQLRKLTFSGSPALPGLNLSQRTCCQNWGIVVLQGLPAGSTRVGRSHKDDFHLGELLCKDTEMLTMEEPLGDAGYPLGAWSQMETAAHKAEIHNSPDLLTPDNTYVSWVWVPDRTEPAMEDGGDHFSVASSVERIFARHGCLETSIKEAVALVASRSRDEEPLVKMIQQETTALPSPKEAVPTLPWPRLHSTYSTALPSSRTTLRLAKVLLAFFCLALITCGVLAPDFCSQVLNSDLKPEFPKFVRTNDPGVVKAARHSAQQFNNCTNDLFLFKEFRISRAMIAKGLKYMLMLEVSRTTCQKTNAPPLDSCDFQTSPTLKWVLNCYSEVWAVPWLQSFEVPVLYCH